MPWQCTPVEVRFWAKVFKTPTCWLWTGEIQPHGYGLLHKSGRRHRSPYRAHRLSWELAYGPIPDDLCVLHRCDVRACVRPDHLFLGSRADNQADMREKHRGRNGGLTGASHPRAKLTDQQVREIRRRYTGRFGEKAELAREYRASQSTIGNILAAVGRFAIK